MRACWSAASTPADPSDRPLVAVGPGRRHGRDELAGPGAGRQPRTFVPVEVVRAAEDQAPAGTTTEAAVAHAAPISPATGPAGRIPGTWWLWGDPEPWPEP
jgi:hypothetical protein